MKHYELFAQATGHDPYPWQQALAAGPWPGLLDVPTGLGKTQGVLSAWLHKRLVDDADTGRRLVWCLPMRGLVEQTGAVAEAMVAATAAAWQAAAKRAPTVHLMLGGDVNEAWELDPAADAIIIGTQDLLLSRALNRGYAMSRYKWPVHFGLLHNDVLWVFDETQLLGVGLETSAQLQGLRSQLGTLGPAHSLWMSATLAADRLTTVDHPGADLQRHGLGPADLGHAPVLQRLEATKFVQPLPDVQLSKAHAGAAYARELAAQVAALHDQRGGLTLVVLNQVARAQAVHQALQAALGDTVPVALVHSRFRPADRQAQEQLLLADKPRVVVATQVVEAGFDLSATTLVTELAPWPSLVQRMGRCNRHGELADGAVYWVAADLDDDKVLRPYDGADLAAAVAALDSLNGHGGPAAVRDLDVSGSEPLRPVLRRRDLLALFDTSPDISGEDLDVGRYVRDGDDTDVFVHWLVGAGDPGSAEPPRAGKDGLCRVSVPAFADFLVALDKRRAKTKSRDDAARLRAWIWDPLHRRWQAMQRQQLRPGLIVALDPMVGGYSPVVGWLGKDGTDPVPEVAQAPALPAGPTPGSHEDDIDTGLGRWVTLANHLGHVRDETRAAAARLAPDHADVLATAGLWHDVGKAHAEFQGRLLDPVADDPALQPAVADGLWAKSNHRLRSDRAPHRRFFRHELASALAWLAHGQWADSRERDLVAYLVLAHHGKVRVSLRSLPEEQPPADAGDCLMAHGVLDGDVIARVEVPGLGTLTGLRLDLGLMQLGGDAKAPSWLHRVLALRDAPDLGLFRLTYQEALLRVADWTASAREQQGGYDDE